MSPPGGPTLAHMAIPTVPKTLFLCLFPFMGLHTPELWTGQWPLPASCGEASSVPPLTFAYQMPALREGGALIPPRPMTQKESRSLAADL